MVPLKNLTSTGDKAMPFSVKDLPFAKDALDGISAKTIETHHDRLYPGYVNKRNEIEAALPNADRSKSAQTYSEYRALKQIGRASCRERVEISEVDGTVKKDRI